MLFNLIKFSWIYGIIFLLAFLSCKSRDEENFNSGKREHTDDVNVVVTSKAKKGTFYKEFENNGTLEACQKAILHFDESGNIASVNVKNGQWVKRGAVLAKVEDTQQRFNYEKACRTLDRSRLSLEESLINQGYTLADSAQIPKSIMQIALTRSGYPDAVNEKILAAHRLKRTKVIAPFDGIVADLEARPNNETAIYNSFCTLIDNHEFEVSFPILEAEMAELEAGMQVEIIPFAFDQDTIFGKLSEINPKVEENGMVKTKAFVKNKNNKLVEGMNVKVLIKKPLGKKTYIPKEAVTLRQEKNVVFVCQDDTAYWHYVDVGESNSRFTVINKGVSEGEEVIVEGHFNLAHLALVKVVESRP
jgi:membrane fusion protein, multidrug efflux system